MNISHRPLTSRASLMMLLLASLLVALGACGEDAADQEEGTLGAGESCQSSNQCQSGLLCLGTVCRDPNDAGNNDTNNDTNNTPNNTPNNNPNNEPNNQPNNDPNNNPNNDPNNNPNNEPNNDPNNNPNNDPNNMPPDRPGELTGGISVFEVNISANALFNIRRGNAGAAFVEPTTEEPPLDTFGDCNLVNVTQNAPEPFGYSAGNITVDVGGNVLELMPSTGGNGSVTYTAPLGENNENIFAPNDTITVAASGNAVAAFEGSLNAPAEHTLTAPAADSSVSAQEDLTLSWSGSGSGLDVAVTISPMDNFFGFLDGVGLNCSPSSDTGQLTIPAAAMARLTGPKLAVVVVKVVNENVEVGNDSIVINATYASGNIVNLR